MPAFDLELFGFDVGLGAADDDATDDEDAVDELALDFPQFLGVLVADDADLPVRLAVVI